jgi:hypothetical protein
MKAHCHVYHSVQIETCLREESPEIGNIPEFGRRQILAKVAVVRNLETALLVRERPDFAGFSR